MDTKWKPVSILEYATKYEVSDGGLIRNTATGKILRPMRVGRKGRGRDRASRSTVRFSTSPLRDFHIGQLVLEAFVSSRPVGHVVMHLDDNTDNNRVDNLRWGTPKENVHDMVHKIRCGGQKLGAGIVLEIVRRRSMGEKGRYLAQEFGISEQRVCDLYKGRSIFVGEAL